MTSNWTKLLSLVLMVVFGFGISDYIPAETMISIDGAEMILVPAGEFKMGTSEVEIDLLDTRFCR